MAFVSVQSSLQHLDSFHSGGERVRIILRAKNGRRDFEGVMLYVILKWYWEDGGVIFQALALRNLIN